PPQHVEELRKLVQAGFSQEGSHLGDARILGQLVDDVAIFPALLLGFAGDQLLHIFFVNSGVVVHNHGAKFQKDEGLPVLTDAALPEKYRTLRGQFDGAGDDRKNRRQKEKGEQADQHIHHALGHAERLPRVLPDGKVRIERGVARTRLALLIPVFGKNVKGETEPAEFLKAQTGAQRLRDSGDYRVGNRAPVFDAEFSEHHPHHAIGGVPPRNVGFPGGGGQSRQNLLQSLSVLLRSQRFAHIEQQQDKRLARTLASFSFQRYHPPERFRIQNAAICEQRGLRDRG